MVQSRPKTYPDGPHPAFRIVKETQGLDGLIVESKTIGTNMVYNLSPHNFSRTGMLLSSGKYKKVPFKVNTLIEMVIDTHGVLFENPIQVLGKVVRLEDGEALRSGSDHEQVRFGVQILQMENGSTDQWEARMEMFESAAERLLTAG
jgi:hypothetical protein